MLFLKSSPPKNLSGLSSPWSLPCFLERYTCSKRSAFGLTIHVRGGCKMVPSWPCCWIPTSWKLVSFGGFQTRSHRSCSSNKIYKACQRTWPRKFFLNNIIHILFWFEGNNIVTYLIFWKIFCGKCLDVCGWRFSEKNCSQEAPSALAPSSSSLSAEVDFDKPRPGFVKGVVVRVFEDGTSFQVKCQLDGQLSGGRGEHLVKVRAWKVWSLEKTLLEPCCSKWRGSGHGSGRAGGRGRSPGLFFDGTC